MPGRHSLPLIWAGSARSLLRDWDSLSYPINRINMCPVDRVDLTSSFFWTSGCQCLLLHPQQPGENVYQAAQVRVHSPFRASFAALHETLLRKAIATLHKCLTFSSVNLAGWRVQNLFRPKVCHCPLSGKSGHCCGEKRRHTRRS